MTTLESNETLAKQYLSLRDDEQVSISKFAKDKGIPLSSMSRAIYNQSPKLKQERQEKREKEKDSKRKLMAEIIPYAKKHGPRNTLSKFQITSNELSRLLTEYNNQNKKEHLTFGSICRALSVNLYLNKDHTLDDIADKLSLVKSAVHHHLHSEELSDETHEKIKKKKVSNRKGRRKNFSIKEILDKGTAAALAFIKMLNNEYSSLNIEVVYGNRYPGFIVTQSNKKKVLIKVKTTTRKNGEIELHDNFLGKTDSRKADFIFGIIQDEETPEFYLCPMKELKNRKFISLRQGCKVGPYHVGSLKEFKAMLSKI